MGLLLGFGLARAFDHLLDPGAGHALDLARFADTKGGKLVKPITVDYHGYDISQLPPPGQGFSALEILNILDVCAPKVGFDLADLGPGTRSTGTT